MESPLLKLHLPAPLVCEAGERILAFDLNPLQAGTIEPDPASFLEKQLSGPAEIPAGVYLFVQRREYLEEALWLAMAVEQQKDGLWERHTLKNKLYVRHLFEDQRAVTQVFRPLESIP